MAFNSPLTTQRRLIPVSRPSPRAIHVLIYSKVHRRRVKRLQASYRANAHLSHQTAIALFETVCSMGRDNCVMINQLSATPCILGNSGSPVTTTWIFMLRFDSTQTPFLAVQRGLKSLVSWPSHWGNAQLDIKHSDLDGTSVSCPSPGERGGQRSTDQGPSALHAPCWCLQIWDATFQ